MNYSEAGLALTKRFEGLRLSAYCDGAGILTIGYGHTGPDVREGQAITEAQAEAFLLKDLADAIACVNAVVTVALTQGQFDALVDFTYNVGHRSLLNSTLLRYVNGGNFAGSVAQFGMWVHAGGEIERGLVARRAAEAALFSYAG
jgi:lysozyme